MNIYDRAVADKNYDEDLWLRERRKGVTATEIAKLATGQKAARRDILEEKISGLRSFTGNRYSDWGLEREIALSNFLELEFGFEASDVLFYAETNSRHLATPDAVWLGEDSVKVAEIKTSKNDLNPEGKFFPKTTYSDQMQWQIYVAGETCTECLFIWEQHNDNWVQDDFGVFRPEPLKAQWVWLPRDDARIKDLILIAEEFLAELDSKIA